MRSMASGPAAQFAIVAGVRDHLTPGMGLRSPSRCTYLSRTALRAGRRRQAHGLARVEETLARDSMGHGHGQG
jgi:hypothetical protein